MNNNPTKKVYNLIILDESGSMMSIKESTIKGFNEIIQSIRNAASKNGLEHWLSIYSFNGSGIKNQVPLGPVDTLTELNEKTYNPDSSTPLYDAIGHACNQLRQEIEKGSDYKVLVTILTDGEENSSHEYGFEAVVALIKELKKAGWIFTYLGANHDVEKIAFSLNINSSMSFNASKVGVADLVAKETDARARFYEKLATGETIKDDSYFEDK